MKLALGIPMIDDVPGEAFAFHLGVAMDMARMAMDASRFDPKITIITPYRVVPHDHARQIIIDACVEGGIDRLMFLDADTASPKGAFGKLMKVMDETGAPLISGHYLRRGNPYTPVWCKQVSPGKYAHVTAAGGVHELDMTGLGCALVDLKWCVEKLPKIGWFKMEQPGKWTTVTDDVVFIRLIREAGGKILGDASIKCTHIGPREIINEATAQPLREVAMVLEGITKAATQGEMNPAGLVFPLQPQDSDSKHVRQLIAVEQKETESCQPQPQE